MSKSWGGEPEAGVIAGGFKTCVPEAALANGTMAHALDYDDYWVSGIGHPTAVLLPAILALGEKDKISGRDIIAAYVVSCEVGSKLASLVATSLLERGWHPTGVLGALAAAAACAKILKLNVEETRIALGIAASETGGLRKNFGTDTKPLHAGKAASNGIVAAMLAKRGFTASQDILEGPIGFCRTLAGMDYQAAPVLEKLGSPYDILSAATIKPYPSCGGTHRCIDAMLHLVKEHHLRAEDVAEIQCKTFTLLPEILIYHHPKTGLEGKFSMEYVMAAALLDGEITLKQFTEEKVLNTKAQEIFQRVKYIHPKPVPGEAEIRHELPQTVTVKLRDGRQYFHEVPYPKGHPKNPLIWEEVGDKFRDCSRLAISPRQAERCIDLVSALESLKDISELMVIIT
ncbi:MmgE/PrpD family protein [Chloroflexota bacterium]